MYNNLDVFKFLFGGLKQVATNLSLVKSVRFKFLFGGLKPVADVSTYYQASSLNSSLVDWNLLKEV